MNKHKSNKMKENSNTVRHLIMGQITTTQNLVAIKEVRHAGQIPPLVDIIWHHLHTPCREINSECRFCAPLPCCYNWGTPVTGCKLARSLHWRHKGRDGVSNHHPCDYVLNRLFKRRSKKTSKLCVPGEFPAQMASNVENVSIWWRHQVRLQIKPIAKIIFPPNFHSFTIFLIHVEPDNNTCSRAYGCRHVNPVF